MSNVVTRDADGTRKEYGEEDGKIIIATSLDVSRHAKSCERERATHGEFSRSREGLGNKVASFPMVAVDMWKKTYGFDWYRATRIERDKWLDTEYAKPFLTKSRKRRR